MTEKQWLDQAEEYDRKARLAYDAGDEISGELYERKADACRHNACYGVMESQQV